MSFYWGGRYYLSPWNSPWRDPNSSAMVRLITGPTTEPLSLVDARDHLSLVAYQGSPPGHPDDNWITGFGLGAAREYCEQLIGRALAPQQFQLTIDHFPCPSWGVAYPTSRLAHWDGIRLSMAAPLISVDALYYTDADGVEQLLDPTSYHVTQYSDPAVIYPASGLSWPTTMLVPQAVRVLYTAGYGDPGDAGSPFRAPGPALPYLAQAGIRLMLGHLYENRESVVTLGRGETILEIPIGVAALLAPLNLNLGVA